MEKDLIAQNNEINRYKRPIISLNGKEYIFSTQTLIIFPFGLILLFFLIFFFFNLPINTWLQEIVARQSVFLLNFISNNMNAEVIFKPEEYYPWYIYTSNGGVFYIALECTGAQVYGILGGIVVFTPHSKKSITSKDVLWRKTKFLIIAIFLTHAINISRLAAQLYLYTIGFEWALIHQSISDFTAYIAAIIIITFIGYKIIPEFFISIYYGGNLIISKLKHQRKIENFKIIKKRKFWIFIVFMLLVLIVIISLILATDF